MNKVSVTPKLKKQLAEYLALKGTVATLEKELKEKKEQLDTELDKLAKSNLFINGKLAIPGVCLVSIAFNGPKLVWASDGKTLTPADREGIALLVEGRFKTESIDVTKIYGAFERGDDELKKLFASKGISAVQESRYDIKKGSYGDNV